MSLIDRRDALGILVIGGTGLMLGIPLAMAQKQTPVRIVELSKLAQEWDAVEFAFEQAKAVLVRIPKPAKVEGRVLEAKLGETAVYLVAHLRVCTHQGCTTPLPDTEHLMVCPCHESTYKAENGSVVSGPAPLPLRGIRLEVKEDTVWASGLL